MKISLNGKSYIAEVTSLSELKKIMGFEEENTVCVLNGFQTSQDAVLNENDSVFLIKKGVMPDRQELEMLMCARHTPELHECFKKAKIGIAGCGGLGSNIAVSLARSGIGTLVIADFDIVEPTNLNRQQYFIKHLGMLKTDALKSLISEINPYVEVQAVNEKITEDNVLEIFGECDIVCEAFDNPLSKAMIVNTLLEQNKEIKVISGSGMAGLESCNLIKTKKIGNRLIICGDGITQAENGVGLMAPRVAVCAGHQANAVLQILSGSE